MKDVVSKTYHFDKKIFFFAKVSLIFRIAYGPCNNLSLSLFLLPLLLINQRIIRLVLCSQFWAAYVPCESQHLNAVQLTLEQVDLIKRLIEKYSQHMQFAASSTGGYLSRLSETSPILNSTAHSLSHISRGKCGKPKARRNRREKSAELRKGIHLKLLRKV